MIHLKSAKCSFDKAIYYTGEFGKVYKFIRNVDVPDKNRCDILADAYVMSYLLRSIRFEGFFGDPKSLKIDASVKEEGSGYRIDFSAKNDTKGIEIRYFIEIGYDSEQLEDRVSIYLDDFDSGEMKTLSSDSELVKYWGNTGTANKLKNAINDEILKFFK
jgi:hypothetical protein